MDWSSEKRLNKNLYARFRKNIKIVFVTKNYLKKKRNRFNVSEAQKFGLNLTKLILLLDADQIYPKSFFLNLTL